MKTEHSGANTKLSNSIRCVRDNQTAAIMLTVNIVLKLNTVTTLVT